MVRSTVQSIAAVQQAVDVQKTMVPIDVVFVYRLAPLGLLVFRNRDSVRGAHRAVQGLKLRGISGPSVPVGIHSP